MDSGLNGKLAYSIPEACKVLGLGRTTLYKLVRAGEIPCVRIGEKRLLIPADAMREWLNTALQNRNT